MSLRELSHNVLAFLISQPGGKLVKSGTFFLFVAVAGLVACTSATPKQEKQDQAVLEAQVKAEPPAMSPDAIAERGAQIFIGAPGLSQEQKRKIMAVYIRTFNDAISIRNEIGQSKSLLFKKVATKSYKSKEVEDLKARIVALDQKRLTVMFKALEEIQTVIGTGPDKEEIWKHFYDFEYPRVDRISKSGPEAKATGTN